MFIIHSSTYLLVRTCEYTQSCRSIRVLAPGYGSDCPAAATGTCSLLPQCECSTRTSARICSRRRRRRRRCTDACRHARTGRACVCRHACRYGYELFSCGHMCRHVCRHAHRHVCGHMGRHVRGHCAFDRAWCTAAKAVGDRTSSAKVGLRVGVALKGCLAE